MPTVRVFDSDGQVHDHPNLSEEEARRMYDVLRANMAEAAALVDDSEAQAQQRAPSFGAAPRDVQIIPD